VVFWCVTLLYLPALIVDTASQKTIAEQQRNLAIIQMIFKSFATPAALIAIASGTTIFIASNIHEHWLIFKLTLIVALVLCHVLYGWAIWRMQVSSGKYVKNLCMILSVISVILIPSIIWIVLTKPS